MNKKSETRLLWGVGIFVVIFVIVVVWQKWFNEEETPKVTPVPPVPEVDTYPKVNEGELVELKGFNFNTVTDVTVTNKNNQIEEVPFIFVGNFLNGDIIIFSQPFDTEDSYVVLKHSNGTTEPFKAFG